MQKDSSSQFLPALNSKLCQILSSYIYFLGARFTEASLHYNLDMWLTCWKSQLQTGPNCFKNLNCKPCDSGQSGLTLQLFYKQLVSNPIRQNQLVDQSYSLYNWVHMLSIATQVWNTRCTTNACHSTVKSCFKRPHQTNMTFST